MKYTVKKRREIVGVSGDNKLAIVLIASKQVYTINIGSQCIKYFKIIISMSSNFLLFFSFFSDPIFPLTFLVNSWVPGMFDALFQASFLCGLLLFWLCIYHGVRQVKQTCSNIFYMYHNLTHFRWNQFSVFFYVIKSHIILIGSKVRC